MEHYCKNCKHDGDNVCKFTGATHTTGIECPSFEPKEVEKQCGDCNQFGPEHVGNCKVRGYGTKANNNACDRFNVGESTWQHGLKRKGYGFLAEENVIFRFWEDRSFGGRGPYFELRTECDGNNLGIIKTGDTV